MIGPDKDIPLPHMGTERASDGLDHGHVQLSKSGYSVPEVVTGKPVIARRLRWAARKRPAADWCTWWLEVVRRTP